MSNFKERFESTIKRKGGPDELLNITKVSRTTFYRWGKKGFPEPIARLIALAQYLEVSLDELVFGETPTNGTRISPPDTRLAQYNLDALPDDERDSLYEELEILLQILTSDDEEAKIAIRSNLKAFRTSVRRRDVIVGNKLADPVDGIDEPGETDRASPRAQGKPKTRIQGG